MRSPLTWRSRRKPPDAATPPVVAGHYRRRLTSAASGSSYWRSALLPARSVASDFSRDLGACLALQLPSEAFCRCWLRSLTYCFLTIEEFWQRGPAFGKRKCETTSPPCEVLIKF